MSIRVLILLLFAEDFLIGQEPVDARSAVGMCDFRLCNKAAPNPVCGSDGKTYENDCGLNNAICENPFLKLAKQGPCEKSQPINRCWRTCPSVIFPVCGSNGKTYENDCELKIASCMKPSIKLATRARCGEGKMGTLCNRPCPKTKRPVCANNGRTYKNECLLKIEICMSGFTLRKVKDGKCAPRPHPWVFY